MKIYSASYYNLLLLNWYLLGVKMNLGHAHKTRFWYLLELFSKCFDEHPCHFHRGVPPPPRVIRYHCALSPVFLLPFSHVDKGSQSVGYHVQVIVRVSCEATQ